MKTSILALLLTSSLAIASVQTQVSKCSGSASCGGSQSNKQNFSGGKLKRDIASLFRRSDPEFDFAMHILGMCRYLRNGDPLYFSSFF
jgi:hypothetical protein